MAEPRDYQRETIDDFEYLVAAGARSVLVTAPTGSRKTVIVSATVARTVAAGQRILVFGHSYKIIDKPISKQHDDQQGQELTSAVATDFDLAKPTRDQRQGIACKP